jgi:hypothetical protein
MGPGKPASAECGSKHTGLPGGHSQLLAYSSETHSLSPSPCPIPLGAPITWCFPSHSCTKFRPSSLIPFWVVSAGYSGSGVPLGNMYFRPPPRITCAQKIRADGLRAQWTPCSLLLESPQLPFRSVGRASLGWTFSTHPCHSHPVAQS